MTPWKHAISSAKKFGGEPEDYAHIHNWFDETKELTANWTHRALRHHAHGVEEAVRKFGHYVALPCGKTVAVKEIAEQHVIEDCGFIPSVADWFKPLKEHPEKWMLKVGRKTRDLEVADGTSE